MLKNTEKASFIISLGRDLLNNSIVVKYNRQFTVCNEYCELSTGCVLRSWVETNESIVGKKANIQHIHQY